MYHQDQILLIFFSSLDANEVKINENEIFKNLRCLVCQGQSVAESNSDFAQTLKLVVRDKINEGNSQKEIYEFLEKCKEINDAYEKIMSEEYNEDYDVSVDYENNELRPPFNSDLHKLNFNANSSGGTAFSTLVNNSGIISLPFASNTFIISPL